MNKEVRKLVAAIERIDGVEVEHGGSHLKVRRDGVFVTTLPKTPSDARWQENALADLRRSGITPATNVEKLSRPPKTIAVRELAAQFRGLRERREMTEFARFVQQLGEVRGLRTYASVDSAAASVQAIAAGKTTSPAAWAHVLLSEGWLAWRRPVPSFEPEPEPEPTEPGLSLVVDLSRLAERLAEFGVRLEVRS